MSELTQEKVNEIIQKLEDFRKTLLNKEKSHFPAIKELEFCNRKHCNYISAMYMPHTELYNEILEKLSEDDIIIDMGSGDFRFPLLISQKVKKVYAVEFNPELVYNALKIIGFDLPDNLIIICADWFLIPIPKDVTIITCLVNKPEIPEEWNNYKLILGFSK
ncbi:MAG: hypothetical protein ACFFDB_00045 [Promethearchaeota archaeon]